MAFNYQAIINSINNFAAQHGLTMYAYTPNFKGVIEALDNLQNIQFSVQDGTIVNADVNANAAIAGTKIDPDFGSQTVITTGNVGIGTTSPSSVLTARDEGGTDLATLRLEAYRPALRFIDINASTSDAEIVANSGSIAFNIGLESSPSTLLSEKARIDSSGNVGIGTTSPGALLHVNSSSSTGRIRIQGGGTSSAQLQLIAGGQTDPYVITQDSSRNLIFFDNASERMRINSSGNVGIGTTSFDPNWAPKLQVSGTASDGTQGILIENYKPAITFKDISGGSPERKHIWADGNALYLGSGDSAQNAQLAIDSSGNVGIGTTGPLSVLHTSLNATDGVGLYLENRADAGSSDAIGLDFLMRRAGGTQFGGTRIRGVKENAWTSTASTINSALTFSTLNSLVASERMRIDSSGNVGIGTTSPSGALVVSNSGAAGLEFFPATFEIQAYNRSTSSYGLARYNAAGHQFAVSGAEKVRIDSSGKVGIGTTVPSCELDIENSSSSEVRLHIANTNSITSVLTSTGTSYSFGGVGASTTWLTTNGTKLAIGPYTAGTLQFINGGERMRIDSSGRLLVDTSSSRGVGDATPAKIQVDTTNYVVFSGVQNLNNHAGAVLSLGKSRGSSAGGVSIVNNNDTLGIIKFAGADGTDVLTTAASIKAEVDGTPGSNDMPGRLVFHTTADGASSPTERMRINSGGTLLPSADNSYNLGKLSNRWAAVYAANGTIQTSDERHKTEIQTSTLGTNFIKSLRPVSYKWAVGQNIVSKDVDGETDLITPRAGVRRHWGFIAQEVKQSVDEAGVDFGGWLLADKDDPDSQQALRYDQFIAPLTKALQEAIAKIETLEQRLSDAGIA